MVVDEPPREMLRRAEQWLQGNPFKATQIERLTNAVEHDARDDVSSEALQRDVVSRQQAVGTTSRRDA
ncbi:MAG: hypothetical protein AAF916_11145 [Planctomycetota bacterium]